MTDKQLHAVVQHLRRAVELAGGVGDAELLARWVSQRDEAAFEVLVWRHGPMVWNVCRRLLRDEGDAEDAFQATFLALVHRAGAIHKRAAVGSWLYRVAYRAARAAQASAARRCRRERPLQDQAAPGGRDEAAARELRPVLDAEVGRLPEKYRAPLVLCYLQGLTNEEAARQLGCPTGTVATRLAWGRERLRRRLADRGLVPAEYALPVPLAHTTVKAAVLFGSGGAGPGAASARAVALAQGVLHAMSLARVLTAAVAALAVGLAAAGAAVLAHQALTPVQPEVQADRIADPQPPEADAPRQRTDRYGDPLPPGARARLGTVRWRMDAYSADAMAVSPAGKTLVTVNASNGIVVWDTATGKVLRRIPEKAELRQEWLGQRVWSVSALSADGRAAALIPFNGAIHVVDLATGEARQSWTNPRGLTLRAILSDDGKVLATRTETEVQIWDAGSGKLLHELAAPRKQNVSWGTQWLALSADGKTLAWVGEDKECPVHVVDVATGKERLRLGEHDGGERQVLLSPDGAWLASTSSHGLAQLWDLKKGQVLHKWAGEENIFAPMAAFTPDGTRLILTRGGDVMRLLDVSTGRELWQVPRPISSSVQDAYAFAPDGKTLFVMEGGDPVIYRHDMATGRQILAPGEQTDAFHRAAFSPDERSLYTLAGDRVLRAWNADTGEEVRQTAVASRLGLFSSDGRLLVVAKGKTAYLYETATGRELRQLSTEPALDLSSITLSPNGELLAVSGKRIEGDKTYEIVIWQVATGAALQQFTVKDYVWDLEFTGDGESLVGHFSARNPEQGRVFRIWNVATGRERPGMRLPANRGPVWLSPDGKTVIVTKENTVLQFWEAATGAKRLEIQPVYIWPASFAYSPDRRSVLVADGQGAIEIHDAFDGRQLSRLTGHRGSVWAFAFSRSGRLLATTAGDTTALVWDAPEVLRRGRSAPGDLSAADLAALWDDLAGDDAAKAFQAIGRLAAAPGQVLPWLDERLKPVPPVTVDGKHLEQLVAELDSDDFGVRERATRELEKLGEFAQPAFDKVLAGGPSVEVRSRIEKLAEQRAPAKMPARLRALRAVEVLEYIGTAEARRLLEKLAGGAPEVRLTHEAKASLERLASGVTTGP